MLLASHPTSARDSGQAQVRQHTFDAFLSHQASTSARALGILPNSKTGSIELSCVNMLSAGIAAATGTIDALQQLNNR